MEAMARQRWCLARPARAGLAKPLRAALRLTVSTRRRRSPDARRWTPLPRSLAARALTCDVTDEDSIAAMAEAAGPIAVAVNTAGTTDVGGIAKIKRERIEAQFAIHVTGNLLFMKHVVAQMGEGGSIVLFSSLTARSPGLALRLMPAPRPRSSISCASQRSNSDRAGIRVNAVAPGFTRTPMTEAFLADERIADIYKNETALGALTEPEQVAAAVAWLAAADCFTTGETIAVSGGAQLLRLPTGAELRG